jgi:adenine-specific DNA methylase
MQRKYVPPSPDTINCPKCGRFYGFVNCRISQWTKDGKRYELCTACAIEKDKHDAMMKDNELPASFIY